MNSRCQVDMTEKQKQAAVEFGFFLLYQDHMTKYLQLPPLKRVKPKISLLFYWIYLLF
jgi:hypothetical protein